MKVRALAVSGAAVVVAALGFAGLSWSQQSEVDSFAPTIFANKCATCHEPAVERAPDRATLRTRTPESVVQALTTGTMNPMASGLTPAMIRNLAVFVTGKQLSPATGNAANALAAGAQPADNKCATNPPIKAAATDWNGFGKTAGSSRYQTNTTITAANVDRLKVKWSFSLAGGRHAQPTVIGDRLFLADFAGDAFSLDAKTGCVYWRKAVGSPMRSSPIVLHKPGYSPSGWVMYIGDFNRDFHAFDAMTGAELWKTNLESHPLAMLTGGPVVSGERIYVPISSSEENMANAGAYSCCTFTGAVSALDLKTGRLVWKARLLDPKPTRRNMAGSQLYGPAGAAVWSQPTIDARRGVLYVAAGDSYTEVDAPTSDAVVAINLADGHIKWSNQVTKADNFLIGCSPARRGQNCPLGTTGPDFDYGASPILYTLPSGKQIVLSGQKSGAVYGMDPDDGHLIWNTQVGFGSALGGVEWGMAADTRLLYVTISDAAAARDSAKPGVYGLNPADGKIVWSTPAPKVPCGWFPAPRCNNAQSAPPTAIPGVVFAGGHDGWLRAYAAGTGRTLWIFNSAGQTYRTANGVPAQPGGSFDHTGFVVSGGSMFAISGYNGATGAYGNPLNVLLAFTLDGK
ncbi:MAG: PQQ-binding-like beta-propeller repeat protein [Alphaproteobacteria bacterium]